MTAHTAGDESVRQAGGLVAKIHSLLMRQLLVRSTLLKHVLQQRTIIILAWWDFPSHPTIIWPGWGGTADGDVCIPGNGGGAGPG